MKKILAILLILIMSLTAMVSCDKIPGLDKIELPELKLPFDLPWQKDEPTETAPTLDDAKTYLFNTYKDSAKSPMSDYDLVAKVIIDGTSFSVTWSTSLEVITIKESTKANFWTVDLPEKNDTEVAYDLIATIADAEGNKVEVKFEKVLPVIDSTGVTTTPVEGVAYKLYFNQINLGYTLYACNTSQNGGNKFINATLDPKEAADFYVEIVDGGYKIYTMVDGAKSYVHAYTTTSDDGKVSKFIGFAAETTAVFSYDSNISTYVITIDGLKYGVGTYGTYETISISDISYFTPDKINVANGQFPLGFMTADHANTLTPGEKPESITDSVKVLEKLYGLADGESVAGTFVITGTITAFDSYNNPTIVVEGHEDQPVYCYKLTNDQFVIGATITVTAKQLKNYNGTYELMDCTLNDLKLPGTEEPVTGESVELTVDSLGLPDQSYNAEASTATVGGVSFEFIQIGNYGDGIQVRDKDGKTSTLWNTTAFSTGIKQIILVYSSTKDVTYANPDCEIFTFGNAVGEATYTAKLSTTAGVKTYTITPDVDTYTFFKFEHDLGYTMYWASITIVLSDGSVVTPCEHAWEAGETVAPTCDEAGYTNYTCTLCSATKKEAGEAATGHSYADGVCGTCGAKDPEYVDPSAPVYEVVDPVVGVAYKFGMVQANNDNTIYYLKGGMDGYYMATTTDIAEALDVYLEATDGGYYMYVLDGESKLYINYVVSGTHVNGAYEATASTVYTYDAESKTVIAPVDGADYWLGTRNDKNYTTMGPCKVEYAGFYGQFYGEEVEDVHTCEFVAGKTVEPTCTTDGYTVYTCECGATENRDVVKAAGHAYDMVVGWHPQMVAADCVTPGVDVYMCDACGDTYTVETGIDPEAHAFWGDETVITEANCATQTNGKKIVSCANEGCGAQEEQEIYYEYSHEWDVQDETPATCTTDGHYYAVCTICQEVEEEFSPAQGHYNWYLACGETGACMGCNEEFVVEHDTEWSPATCTEPAFCMNCMSYVGEPLGHNYVDGVCTNCEGFDPDVHVCEFEATDEVVAPTCTEAGYTVYACACGKTENRDAVEATGHNYVAGDPVAPTCTEPGYTVYSCECGASENRDAVEATGHNYVAGEPVAPTCTVAGYTVYACACGASENRDAVAATGHAYAEGTCGNCGGEDPDYHWTLSIPEVLASDDGKKVIVSGVVISTDSWNTQYKNMSVTIKDADGNTLYVYRLGTQVGLGDTITVTGVVGSYNNAKQIAQGATATIDVVHGDNHTYEDGYCTVCNTKQPSAGEETTVCDFSSIAAGTQYADESKTFGDITVSSHNKGCHFNTQLRIYDSDTNNGWAILTSTSGKTISDLTINMGYKKANLEVYASVDGTTWVLVETVTTTSTSYLDYTVNLDTTAGYKYVKIDAVGAQIRVAKITVTTVG